MEYKVLITTSGLGSRLGHLTEFTNKSLVRVSNKPAIAHIVESYPIDTDFVITLGHFGSHVRQFLKLVYPERHFTFVEVDKYSGKDSSLGYSIFKCRSELECPFIFHASDTIIDNYKLIEPTVFNYVLGSYKDDNYSEYRNLKTSEDVLKNLISIEEKGAVGFYPSYMGVCGIKDYLLFFEELEKLIKNKVSDISDAHVINNMLDNVPFLFYEVERNSWHDVGNIYELNKFRKTFKTDAEILDKRDESIFLYDDKVVKFFSNSKTVKDRVDRAKYLKNIVPEILGSSENFYKYKKVGGELFSKSVNAVKFKKFLEWSKKNLWTDENKDINFNNDCYNFYVNKTLNRVKLYLSEYKDQNKVNGVILPEIKNFINSLNFDWLCDGIPSRIHGDLILDNIIEKKTGDFCLIDWRQDFSGRLSVGDLYYDLAKLNHSLTVNHSIINKNLFSCDPDNCYILTSSILNECKDILHSFIVDNNYSLKKVEVLTSLIWINMSPLHSHPFNNFLFNFGKYNLYLKY